MRISDWSSDVCSSDLGGGTYLYARAEGEAMVVVEVEGDSRIKVGDQIDIGVPSAACHLFDAEGMAVERAERHPLADVTRGSPVSTHCPARAPAPGAPRAPPPAPRQLGRASCRDSVRQYLRTWACADPIRTNPTYPTTPVNTPQQPPHQP